MMLFGAAPRPVGLIVRFEIALRDGTPVFRGEGKVVAHHPSVDPASPGALQVRFTRLDPRGKSIVDRAVARNVGHAPSGTRSPLSLLPPAPLEEPPASGMVSIIPSPPDSFSLDEPSIDVIVVEAPVSVRFPRPPSLPREPAPQQTGARELDDPEQTRRLEISVVPVRPTLVSSDLDIPVTIDVDQDEPTMALDRSRRAPRASAALPSYEIETSPEPSAASVTAAEPEAASPLDPDADDYTLPLAPRAAAASSLGPVVPAAPAGREALLARLRSRVPGRPVARREPHALDGLRSRPPRRAL